MNSHCGPSSCASALHIVLTIAASDSSSGAGIQADLSVFRDIGTYGVCAVTNVTAQNSRGVMRVTKVAPRTVAAQIDAVTRDFKVEACKIGMVYSPQAVSVVAERIKRRRIPNVVLDPVMRAKNGQILLTEPAAKRLKRLLLPLAFIVTPNLEEARALTGMSSARDAALKLVELGAKWVLVKGGHAEGDPIDLLTNGNGFTELDSKRINKNMHGSGCVLSAAIAARLALGDAVPQAVRFAKEYVTRAIEHSVRLGKGDLDYFTGCR